METQREELTVLLRRSFSLTSVFFQRATTYYLADRRYDMLPAVLSADLCSLLGGVDRSVNATC